MKKHLISLLVLFLMVSSSLVGVSNLATDDSFSVQQDSYQYMMDWSVHLTNQTPSEEASRPYYNHVESGYMEPSPLSGPMDSAWPMCSYDNHHTGQSPHSTQNNPGAELWRIHGYEAGKVESSAIINQNGTIYFGTTGSDGSLYAIKPNGTISWRYQTNGASLIWSTPVLAEDGTIYVPTWGGWPPYLYALYADGSLKWTFGLYTTSSPAIGDDGTIYIGDDNQYFHAINPNGTEQWQYTTGDFIQSSPAIADDGTIYVGSADHYLYAFHPNGTLYWRFETGDWIKSNPSVGADGTIYIPSFDGNLYALYPDGTLKWSADAGNQVIPRGIAIANDGTLYVGTEALRAFNPNNGTVKWTCDVGGQMYGTFPAISADGIIYVSAETSLVAVNPDGTEKWRRTLSNEQVRSSPSIGDDGQVYVGSTISDYGYLHAFSSLDTNAPTAPTITGQTNGRIKKNYSYTFTSTSPLDKDIFYMIDWGDDSTTDWLGPYNSGETITMKHSWTEKGTYTIKARARDTDNLWGPWGELQITMPLSYEQPQFPFIQWLLERFPNAFPLLRYLIGCYE